MAISSLVLRGRFYGGIPKLITHGLSIANVVDSDDIVTKGWISPSEYKKYRKKLEDISRASREFDRKKFIDEVEKISEIVNVVDADAPEINKVVGQKENKARINFDFTKVQAELRTLISRLEVMMQEKEYAILNENEEESILVMLI